MSKQYLTIHTVDEAHVTDIYALAATSTTLISGSGASSLKIHSTADPTFPLLHTVPAHQLGCHHLSVSGAGSVLASAGFEGTVKVWRLSSTATEKPTCAITIPFSREVGQIWAVAMSYDGAYLAGTTYDGKILVWDVTGEQAKKIQEYETKGSFGMSVAMSRDGMYTASGHESGGVFVFNNEKGRLMYTLPTNSTKPIRTLAFSPAGSRLAAAGDNRAITLFDVAHGEQTASLSGHTAWILAVDWSDTGEYVLSGAFDGKAKVWSVDTRTCVATHNETEKTIWSVKWLPKMGKNEMFATGGANKSVSIYREATGG